MNRRVLIAAGVGVAAGLAATAEAKADTTLANPAPLIQQMRDTQDARMALYELDRMERDKQTRTMLRQLTGAPALINKKIAVLGDSITVGYGSADMNGYRTYLTDLMDRRGYAANLPMLANAGWSVNDLKPALAAFLAANPNLDYALLLLGTNDVGWGMDLTGWGAKYDAIVSQILAVNSTVKVVCGKIPLSNTNNPTGKADLYVYENALNGWIQTSVNGFASTGRVVAVDHSTVSTQWLLDGGWHPGDAGYLKMAKNWDKQLDLWL